MSITKKEYLKRVSENTAEYKHQRESNSCDLKRYHGVDASAGELSDISLISKAHDIIGAIMLGCLPILKSKSGVDAIKLDKTGFVPVELKTTHTDQGKFVVTPNGAVYSVTQSKIVNGTAYKNNTTSINSLFNATYSICNNIHVKGIDTYLLVIDSITGCLVEAYEMPGSIMQVYLEGRTVPASGSITIKLATFAKLGKVYTKTAIKSTGLEKWKNALKVSLPVVRITSNRVTLP